MVEGERFPDITESGKDPYKHISCIKHYVVFHIMEMTNLYFSCKNPQEPSSTFHIPCHAPKEEGKGVVRTSYELRAGFTFVKSLLNHSIISYSLVLLSWGSRWFAFPWANSRQLSVLMSDWQPGGCLGTNEQGPPGSSLWRMLASSWSHSGTVLPYFRNVFVVLLKTFFPISRHGSVYHKLI